MKQFLVGLVALVTFSSCDNNLDKIEGGSGSNIAFDRSSLLINWADNFIVPQFEAFLSDAEDLKTAKDNFIAETNAENLVALQEASTEAYKTFQPVAVYEIGKAVELNYYLNLNAHPVNIAGTEENIMNFEEVNLASVLNQDRQGLPAIDYLVHGLGLTQAQDNQLTNTNGLVVYPTNDEILQFYTGTNGDNYLAYLDMVVDRLVDLTSQVTNDWKNGYRDTFITNTSASSNGAVAVLVNKYIEYYERRLRSSKIGTPIGRFSNNGETFPNQIESLFKPELSRVLAIVALENVADLYRGGEGIGLDDVLEERGNQALATEISTELTTAINSLQTNLSDNIYNQVLEDIETLKEVRDDLQEVTISFKTEMVSILGIDVTFVDNDGD